MAARVLVIEDEPDLAELYRHILAHGGLEAQVITDGRAGLDALEGGVDCDLLLLDLMLPHVDGFHILEVAIAQRGAHFPVVVVSARGGVDDRQRALRSGAALYVEKPFDPERLVTDIQRLLGHARSA